MRRSREARARTRDTRRAGASAYVPEGFLLEGVLEGRGRLVVAGTVVGEVRVAGEVEVLGSGRIEGPVRAKRVRIAGRVEGDVHAAERIEVLGEGQVGGRMEAPRVRLSEASVRPAASTEEVHLPLEDAAERASDGEAPHGASAPEGLPDIESPEPLPPLAMPKMGRTRVRARRLGG